MRRSGLGAAALALWLSVLASTLLSLAALSCAGNEPPAQSPSRVEIPNAADSEEQSSASHAPPPKRSALTVRWMDHPAGSDDDRRKAAAIFDEATAAIRREGHSAEACALFEECLALDPAIGALMNLAACRDAIGDKQTACELYAEAVDWAERNQRKAVAERARAQLKSGNCPALPP
ncbi:MAG: hypothetical protein R3B13_17830 [Polyangiaceae bacterium]